MLREFLLFGLKQAWACLFGGLFLGLMLTTRYWYPFDGLYRYDFLFVAAVIIQALLLAFRLEQYREAGVIVVFHLVATAMELFKTSGEIGAWSYPGEAVLKVGNVPLFAGFMYSAVGSYIARIWRGFEFRFRYYPDQRLVFALAVLAYLNFFSHHYIWDIRWILLATSLWIFRKTSIHFKIDKDYRQMPLVLGLTLVALFIWLAENLATYAQVWIYPAQEIEWEWVSAQKIVAWYLLMLLSFALVALVHRPKSMAYDGARAKIIENIAS